MTSIKLLNFTTAQERAVTELCKDLEIKPDPYAAFKVSASLSNELSISGDNHDIKITYRRENELFRALSYLPDYLKNGKEIHETSSYKMLCYMGDCSRNAVYNISTAKQMIRYLARMGYDSMMLYTEDTYELPDYPYFGHMRGRFSETELTELDDYATMFGIELIPCIQTLAHMSTALRWPDFDGYKDSEDILLVGDERTYQFVETAIRQCRKCFRSKRINIGMDEAHLIACGEYLKRNGYRKPSDVMLEHLQRVVKICQDADFAPMIWGDMFFRMAFDGKYYITEGNIPADVIAKVPKGLTLIYWDYYSMNPELVHHMLECFAQFNNPYIFAGGAWKWYGFGAHNRFSIKSTDLQLNECEKMGVNQIIVTSWGDNGGEASQFSSLASALYFAERCYRKKETVDDAWLNTRAVECTGVDYETLLAFDLPDMLPEITVERTDNPKNPSKYLLYNDPLERLLDCHFNPETASHAFAENGEKLMILSQNNVFGYAYETLGRLCQVLALKCDLGFRIYQAYQKQDREALQTIADKDIPQIVFELREFLTVFRRQWYRENKTFGFVTQELRIGGLIERMNSVQLRLIAYLKNEIEVIEELEYMALPVNSKRNGHYIKFNLWNKNVNAGIL